MKGHYGGVGGGDLMPEPAESEEGRQQQREEGRGEAPTNPVLFCFFSKYSMSL